MSSFWRKIILVTGVLVLAGLLKQPVEGSLRANLRAQGFLPQMDSVTTADQVSVQGAMGVLGGLRFMVAAFLELQALGHWEPPPRWAELAEAYQLINRLQPKNVASWETAAWHLAYNASAYYRRGDDPRWTPLQRELFASEYEDRGLAVLRRGIQWNPQSFSLPAKMADIYRGKKRDYCRAAEAYLVAAQVAGAPEFYRRFYAYNLAKCAGREREAYRELRTIYEEGLRSLQEGGEMVWKPTLIVELARMEEELNVPLAERIPERFDVRRFRIASPWYPRESLPIYRDILRQGEDPVVAAVVERLEQRGAE